MAQMCLVSDRMVPEGWAGTFITPLRPSRGLMSSELLTEFIGEFSWNIWGLRLGPYPIPGEFMEWGPIGELMTEKGDVKPFMGEPSELMGECREPECPMDGLNRDGCIPLWDVGEPRGDEVIWPDESEDMRR